MTLTLRQLQYLVAVADQRNFRRAANILHVAQPTLSLQLQKLEQQLGVRLVERGRGPVKMSPVGREVVLRARKVLLDVTDLEACARQGAGGQIGTIRLGVSPTLGPYLLPGIVGVLRRTLPELRLHIREGIAGEHLQELRSGALDMMVSTVPMRASELHAEPLFQEQMYLVAPPDHPLCTTAPLTRAELIGSKVLSIDTRYPFHHQTRTICQELGLELLSDYEGTSLDSLCQMCASGLGLAVLPELYLQSDVGGKNVVAPLRITDWSGSRSVEALWRKQSVYDQSFRMIAEVIQREAKALLTPR